MLNRSTGRVNDGSIDTTDEQDSQWRVSATYTPIQRSSKRQEDPSRAGTARADRSSFAVSAAVGVRRAAMGALASAVAATAGHRAALFVEAPSVVSGHWRALMMDQCSSKEYPLEDLGGLCDGEYGLPGLLDH
jgi:hypothetical protein